MFRNSRKLTILLAAFFFANYCPVCTLAADRDVVTTTNGGVASKIEGSNNTVNITPGLKQPTFTEEEPTVCFALGKGWVFGYKLSVLEKKPQIPYDIGGFCPVTVYAENGMIYADVMIYVGRGITPIEIKHNKISNVPLQWDMNKSDTAFEIVNEKNIPVYQFFYRRPSYIVMNGIFFFPNGNLIFANESGLISNPVRSIDFKLKRIFKYPAWKYPGKYDD